MVEMPRKMPRLRPRRAWVPVSPDGFVCWYGASTKREYAQQYAGTSFGGISWPAAKRAGWRVVRCEVVKQKPRKKVR